jgi:hypothetical protein
MNNISGLRFLLIKILNGQLLVLTLNIIKRWNLELKKIPWVR